MDKKSFGVLKYHGVTYEILMDKENYVWVKNSKGLETNVCYAKANSKEGAIEVAKLMLDSLGY